MASLYETSSRLSGPGCGYCPAFLCPRSKTAQVGTKAELPRAVLLINDAAFQNLGAEKRLCCVIRATLGEKRNLVSRNLTLLPALPDYSPDGAGPLCSVRNETLKLGSHRGVRATTQRETPTETPHDRRKHTGVTSAGPTESCNSTLPLR